LGRGAILLESIMTTGIRYLAGAFDDIRFVCGVSTFSYFRSVYKFLDACPELMKKSIYEKKSMHNG
jgi:hypothetical protein